LSFNYTNLVWDRSPYRAEKLLVLLALADWSDTEGVCFPSYAKIAEKARVSKPGAIGIIQSLIKDGAIEIIEAGNGRGNHHSYRLLPDNWKAKPAPERVKQDEERVNQEEVKVNSPLPFMDEERVKQESIKGKGETIKGKAGRIKGKAELVPCKEEPFIEPFIEPLGESSSSGYAAKQPPKPYDLYAIFAEAFKRHYDLDYRPSKESKKADFGQLKNLLEQYGDGFRLDDWQARAVPNYFNTPQASHAAKDLATRYATFRRSPLDKYGKPIINLPARGSGSHLSQAGQQTMTNVESVLQKLGAA
jgi:hypothetical protein